MASNGCSLFGDFFDPVPAVAGLFFFSNIPVLLPAKLLPPAVLPPIAPSILSKLFLFEFRLVRPAFLGDFGFSIIDKISPSSSSLTGVSGFLSAACALRVNNTAVLKKNPICSKCSMKKTFYNLPSVNS